MSINVEKNGPFDIKTIESLVALMAQHDLNEIYLREGGQRVRLRRGAGPAVADPLAPAPSTVASALAADPTPIAAPKKNLSEIKSETVGLFYSQPKPGDPPYVKLGDRVTPSKPVGMIVVMKTNHELQAGCTGIIVEVLIENEQAVDFGQVLFRVEPI